VLGDQQGWQALPSAGTPTLPSAAELRCATQQAMYSTLRLLLHLAGGGYYLPDAEFHVFYNGFRKGQLQRQLAVSVSCLLQLRVSVSCTPVLAGAHHTLGAALVAWRTTGVSAPPAARPPLSALRWRGFTSAPSSSSERGRPWGPHVSQQRVLEGGPGAKQ
jgi:hypothetical protein